MRYINILSLVEAYRHLDGEVYKKYLKHHGICLKNEEIEDLESLLESMHSASNMNDFNWFFVGYKIPQIGKEFDLLRFGRDSIINLELKSASTPENINKQLKRNRYYLSYMGKEVHNLTYVSRDNKLYILDRENELSEVDFSYLGDLLRNQKVDYIENIDELFNPSSYLVSPFNSTAKFIEGCYFLTAQQEDIKCQVMQSLLDKRRYNFISITGSAGTGKTLLVYDIVKTLNEENKNPLLIHCGNLNEGQHSLNINGWVIIPIKHLESYNLLEYDAVIIDEAQRIYPNQLDKVIEQIKQGTGSCIFSYDKVQTLAKSEENNDIDSKIKEINQIYTYILSEKIRTNKEISTFIKMLFNSKRNLPNPSNTNIELNYFKSPESAKEYLETLDKCEWEVLRFTPSQHNSEYHEKYSDVTKKTSHKVIGQEFDGVAVIIDKYFSYNEYGKLIYRGRAYYDPEKMLFQNITRTRKKLKLVVIDNEEILARCMVIVQ
ncbi:DNA/RNA helicase domain-containing protein [Acidithiobacillus ferriphilus]|uniref:DNA/RNA helicase domain-containing protein n=1 Tax=Acidithiobacillus ferriphilus TaxID=1689834 RepID=UPI00232AEA70|nr:ATP-binding protein [Acidithiobacillus ferriphilus]WCE94576.1 ATP-binding protein [Acidithiobacillus ferriphilus]